MTFSKQVDIVNPTEIHKRKKIQRNYKNQTQKWLHEGILSRKKSTQEQLTFTEFKKARVFIIHFEIIKK